MAKTFTIFSFIIEFRRQLCETPCTLLQRKQSMTCSDGEDISKYEGLFMDGENVVRRKYDDARRSSDIY